MRKHIKVQIILYALGVLVFSVQAQGNCKSFTVSTYVIQGTVQWLVAGRLDSANAREQLKLPCISGSSKDGLLHISQRTHAYLKTNNVPHIYHVDDHGHDFGHWKNSLYWFTQRVFTE